MLQSFLTLFTQADVLFYILYAFSIILLIVEVFLPSFGIVGMGGLIMALGAIVVRCIHGNNSSNEILFFVIYLVLILTLIVGLVKLSYYLHLKLSKRKKYAIIDGNKVPLTNEGNPDYSFLIGQEGEVISDLKPTGKVKFSSGTFEATSSKEYIYKGTIVKGYKVINQKLVVKKKG